MVTAQYIDGPHERLIWHERATLLRHSQGADLNVSLRNVIPSWSQGQMLPVKENPHILRLEYVKHN